MLCRNAILQDLTPLPVTPLPAILHDLTPLPAILHDLTPLPAQRFIQPQSVRVLLAAGKRGDVCAGDIACCLKHSFLDKALFNVGSGNNLVIVEYCNIAREGLAQTTLYEKAATELCNKALMARACGTASKARCFWGLTHLPRPCNDGWSKRRTAPARKSHAFNAVRWPSHCTIIATHLKTRNKAWLPLTQPSAAR